MTISISTNNVKGFERPRECIGRLMDVGVRGITFDLEVFYSPFLLETYRLRKEEIDIQKKKAVINGFLEECMNSSMPLDVVRAPHLKWDTKRTDLNDLMLQIGWDSIDVCSKAEAKSIVIQPLFAGIAKSDLWKQNYHYYMELGIIAQEKNVHILLENQCGYKRNRFVRGVCSNPLEAAEWIDSMNKELGDEVFGFCFDTCAGMLSGQNIGEMAVELGSRLKAVRLRESGCFHEMSGLPFMGSSADGEGTDWKGLIRGLRRSDFDGTLILDAGDTMRNLSHLLRPYFYPLLRSVADYIGWQVGLEKGIKKYPQRVLFGVGNMCKHYMECYGEQYPPLFACDNNAELWGKRIHGLEVKSPEVLRELQAECAVIICNTFYEEIAEQLKQMGVQSIETFNDEYLF